MNRLAIFDCDGTLVDSGSTIHRALAETFRHQGLSPPPPRVCRRVIGLNLVEAMADVTVVMVIRRGAGGVLGGPRGTARDQETAGEDDDSLHDVSRS